MAALIKPTLENRNEKRTSVSISGPAYMVAVGGAARGSRAKTRSYVITSRYLGPSIGSCHDLCKHGNGKKDESLEIKKHETGFGSRKMLVMKDRGVERNVVPVERIKMIETKRDPKISARDDPLKKIGAFKQSLLGNRNSNKNELELSKNHVKAKSGSSSNLNGCSGQLNGQIKIREVVRKSAKVNHNGSLPRKSKLVSPSTDQNKMTKNKNKQLIAEKVTEMTEMTMNGTKREELQFVPITVEIIASSPTVTTESTNLPSSESSQSSSYKQVIEEEHEHTDPEEVILNGVDYAIVTSEGDGNYRVVICKDEETGGLKVLFRKGEVVEVQSEENGPRKLKFRRGKVLEDNGDEESIARISFKKKPDEARPDCENESETVTLKHQEVQERKEAQELLNRVIEETASKLVVDKKTKVRALVGAFESVISLQDGLLLTTS